jgi:hypothetical protein
MLADACRARRVVFAQSAEATTQYVHYKYGPEAGTAAAQSVPVAQDMLTGEHCGVIAGGGGGAARRLHPLTLTLCCALNPTLPNLSHDQLFTPGCACIHLKDGQVIGKGTGTMATTGGGRG